jgi:hypothetical protein
LVRNSGVQPRWADSRCQRPQRQDRAVKCDLSGPPCPARPAADRSHRLRALCGVQLRPAEIGRSQSGLYCPGVNLDVDSAIQRNLLSYKQQAHQCKSGSSTYPAALRPFVRLPGPLLLPQLNSPCRPCGVVAMLCGSPFLSGRRLRLKLAEH